VRRRCPRAQLGSQPVQQIVARQTQARCGRRRRREVDADPDHSFAAADLDQDPAELAAAQHQVVRPFEPDVGPASLRRGHAGGEAQERVRLEHERRQQRAA